VDVEFCPPSIVTRNDTWALCADETPQLNATAVNSVYADLELTQQDSFSLPAYEMFHAPNNNLLHLVLAAVRIDLGNPSPNNFSIHPRRLTKAPAAVETPPVGSVESGLYTYLATQLRVSTAEGDDRPAASVFEPWGFSGYNSDSAFDVFHVPGPSVLQTVYACRLLRRRSTGNLTVTVFVATAGMFTSSWAFFIFMARYFADRQKGSGDKEEMSAIGE
jgi:hypothetical protein